MEATLTLEAVLQARMQIRAITEVQPIEAVCAWDENPEASAKFKAEIEGEFGLRVRVADSKREAVAQADILITTTSCRIYQNAIKDGLGTPFAFFE